MANPEAICNCCLPAKGKSVFSKDRVSGCVCYTAGQAPVPKELATQHKTDSTLLGFVFLVLVLLGFCFDYLFVCLFEKENMWLGNRKMERIWEELGEMKPRSKYVV